MVIVDQEKLAYLKQLPYTAIPLHGSRGEGKYVLVDGDYDGAYFSQWKWYLSPLGYPYRMASTYEGVPYAARTIFLHREVCISIPGLYVTHLNGDKLDCRSCNLWPLTPGRAMSQARRQTVRLRRINPYRGVTKDFDLKRWRTAICGRYVAHFDNPEAAARHYDKLAYKRWGDKAILNFPEDYLNKQ